MCVSKCLLVALHVLHAGALLLHGSGREQHTAEVPHFDTFRKNFGRSYTEGSAEYAMRRSLYEKKASAALLQNSQAGALWTAGVSFLWDWTEEEFAQLRGWKRSARPGYDAEGRRSPRAGLVQTESQPLPQEKSYGHLSTFGTVPDQGACGSCWAVAGARVLQAHSEIHTNQSRTFSAQQLVSCVDNPQECGGKGGCSGATVELAYAWVMNNGLATASQVPYYANNSDCTVATPLTMASSPSSTNGAAASFGMHGWERLPENKYEPLLRALVEHGPVAVSASARWWALYSVGIFNGCPAATVIEHAVVLIGFGEETNRTANITTKFWTIQNSWGAHWGEAGNIRLLRQDQEEKYCGINIHPEMGTACLGGPSNVTVCGMCGILYDSVVPFF